MANRDRDRDNDTDRPPSHLDVVVGAENAERAPAFTAESSVRLIADEMTPIDSVDFRDLNAISCKQALGFQKLGNLVQNAENLSISSRQPLKNLIERVSNSRSSQGL
jgi:hypothetical protein